MNYSIVYSVSYPPAQSYTTTFQIQSEDSNDRMCDFLKISQVDLLFIVLHLNTLVLYLE